MRKLRAIIIALVLALAVLLALQIFTPWFNKKATSFEVTDEKGLIQAIEHSANIKKNKEYTLAGDITLDISKLPDTSFDFYGKLNGRGYNIVLTAEEPFLLDRPVFNVIMNGATITQLNLIVEYPVTVGSERSDAAVLANVNHGTISDCSVMIDKILIGKECQNAAALVNFNFSVISKICATVKSIEEVIKTEEWSCRFGVVATVNYATIKDVFVDVSFDNGFGKRLSVFDNNVDNRHVGYVVGGFAETSLFEEIIIISNKDELENFQFWAKALDSVINASFYRQSFYKDMPELWNSVKERWQDKWELSAESVYALPALKSKVNQ